MPEDFTHHAALAAPASSRARARGPVVRLAGLGTALPPHVLPQDEVFRRARAILAPRFPGFDKLAPSFQNAGIAKRHSVVPFSWFEEPRGWVERGEAFEAGAQRLFEQAAEEALRAAGWRGEEVDAIVTVGTTGVATPTLEARAAGRLRLRADVMRVPVFGLGCAGGVAGLAAARELAAARPGARVLMVAVECCTLSFRMDRLRKADIIATVLFGDGAAAACLAAGAPESGAGGDGPVLGRGTQHTWPDTLDIMGWSVEEDGLGVIFDRSIPDFATEHFAAAAAAALGRMDLTREEVDRFVFHPGGAKVVEALEAALGLLPGSLDHERAVLREAGNMSSPTALFVLERALAAGARGQMVLGALGPGFTAAFLPVTA